MTRRPTCLIDPRSATVGTLDVHLHEGLFEGTVCLDRTPLQLRQMFEEFEEIVEGQALSRIDDIEERIAAMQFRVAFDDGSQSAIDDLQIYPTTGNVSFAIRQPVVAQ